MRFIACFATIASILFASSSLSANTFHGGSITWRVPDPALPNTVEFHVLTYWDVGNVGTINVDFGDGNSSGDQTPAVFRRIDDAGEGAVESAELFVVHSYANGLARTVGISGTGRDDQLSGTISNGPWRIESRVDFTAGNRSGPSIAYVPPIYLEPIGVQSFTIPMADFDGDPVTCRFATSAESGIPAGELPPRNPQGIPATIVSHPDECEVIWDTTGIAFQRSAFPIIFESDHGGGLSTTPVDFVVEVLNQPLPRCTLQATVGGFGAPTSFGQHGVFVVPVGQTFSATFEGFSPAQPPFDFMFSETQFDPPGSAIVAGSGNSPLLSTVDWSPNALDRGLMIPYSVSMFDDFVFFSTCSLLLYVPECDEFGQSCFSGVGECERRGVYFCDENGLAVCDAIPGQPSAEVCDSGLDSDCDGELNTGCCGNGEFNEFEDCDDGEFNGMNGSCCAADCTILPEGTVCDPANGACDVEDTCDAAGFCSFDFQPAGFECRPADGVCDVAEVCDGDSFDCPEDLLAPDDTPCIEPGICGGGGVCGDGECDVDDDEELDCDDDNDCTADGCAEPGGCFNQPIEGCCNSDGDCDATECAVVTCEDNACVVRTVDDECFDVEREPITLEGGGCSVIESDAAFFGPLLLLVLALGRRRRGVR